MISIQLINPLNGFILVLFPIVYASLTFFDKICKKKKKTKNKKNIILWKKIEW